MEDLELVTITGDGELIDSYFDITIIVTKYNQAMIVDNSKYNWKDYVDHDTLIVKKLKLEI